VASTAADGRAVVELLAHLTHDGRELAWPVTIVAESPDDSSVVFRTYYSQWPITGRHHVRHPILKPGQAHPGDVVGRYQATLDAYPLVAGQIADPAAGQQQGAVAERVPGDDPLQAGGSGVQLGLDGWQGDVDDAEIQPQDELRRAD
jgi:hypothetical protein